MIKVAVLVGSLRRGSYNRMIAKHMKSRYKDSLDIEIIDIDFPNFNEELETPENLPESVKIFQDKIQNADAVFMITPEYNHGVSGVLKNAIDWASRVKPGLSGKPGLIASSSMGATAGARAYINLLTILDTMPMYLLPGNDIMIGGVHTKFDDGGNLTDEGTVTFIDTVMARFAEFYEQLEK